MNLSLIHIWFGQDVHWANIALSALLAGVLYSALGTLVDRRTLTWVGFALVSAAAILEILHVGWSLTARWYAYTLACQALSFCFFGIAARFKAREQAALAAKDAGDFLSAQMCIRDSGWRMP